MSGRIGIADCVCSEPSVSLLGNSCALGCGPKFDVAVEFMSLPSAAISHFSAVLFGFGLPLLKFAQLLERIHHSHRLRRSMAATAMNRSDARSSSSTHPQKNTQSQTGTKHFDQRDSEREGERDRLREFLKYNILQYTTIYI